MPCLGDRVESIRSRDDLVGFVRELVRDLEANPGEWENATLVAYLESLAAWLEDLEGYDRNRGDVTPDPPGWKTFGKALLAAKVYE
jgi:hypothetical protein